MSFFIKHATRPAQNRRSLVLRPQFARFLAIAAGCLIIAYAGYRVPVSVVKALKEIASFTLPFLLRLFFNSFTYLWQPLTLYLLLTLLIRSKLLRAFCLLAAAAWCLLGLMNALEQLSWRNFHLVPLLALQVYLLLLWLLPAELWNLIGLGISSLLGAVILILPDLPGAFDDFGVFVAILTFFLGYLNACARLTQRIAALLAAHRW